MSSVTLVAHVSLSTIRHKDVSIITLHSESQWKMIIYYVDYCWLADANVAWHPGSDKHSDVACIHISFTLQARQDSGNT